MTDENESGVQWLRIIRQAKEEAYHARRGLRRELPNPAPDTKTTVAAALADYRDLLWDYHEENALRRQWSEYQHVDKIDECTARTATIERELNRRGHATREEQVPLAATVPAPTLIAAGKELDAIAKELGFAANARNPTARGEATHEDLYGLLKARGQEDALENLPESWQPDIPGDQPVEEADGAAPPLNTGGDGS